MDKINVITVVTDSNVDKLYGDKFVSSLADKANRVERIVFPAGEKFKILETYVELVRGFAALGMTRYDVAYALGGGVVGDLTGFAAASYMRGIDFVQVPTTLLAMVDSSIGGKTGVDIPEGKNLVGAFHAPKAIVRDYNFLKTLPERELKNGFAEMIKTAILFDKELFEVLKRHPQGEELHKAIERCAELKTQIVEADFKEGGKRKLLNLGHTFGHAFEKLSNFELSHGEAVAMGLRIVGRKLPEIAEILDSYGFGAYDGTSDDEVIKALTMDKKREGDKVTLIIPKRIGECEMVLTPIDEVERMLK